MEEKREYNVQLQDSNVLVVVQKVVKNPQGIVQQYKCILPNHDNKELIIKPENIVEVIPTITNTEFFIMSTQFLNCVNKNRISYDFNKAIDLQRRIINTINQRGITQYGNGAFEEFDRKRYLKVTSPMEIFW